MLEAQGPFAPIVTPFTDDARVLSEIRLSRLVRFLMGLGVTGVVTGTETGEFGALSVTERKEVLEIVVRESQSAMPVIAHVSSLSTSVAMDLAQHAAQHGARAAVVMPPYYGDPSEREIIAHLQNVAAYAGLPLIIVDPLEMVTEGVREAMATAPRVVFANSAVQQPTRSDSFVVEDAVVSPLCLLGHGQDLAWRNAIWRFFQEKNHAAAAKAALHVLELECGPLRLPNRPLTDDETRQLEFLMSS
jgi:dihydrodipicolinate synthase/N-acetylneuraminate lyase